MKYLSILILIGCLSPNAPIRPCNDVTTDINIPAPDGRIIGIIRFTERDTLCMDSNKRYRG